MWIHQTVLRRVGFRPMSDDYWKCERGHGLPAEAYLSLFPAAADGPWAEVWAFHVTFYLGVDRVHFYYHDAGDGTWEPGGHTSGREIRRHAARPLVLRRLADIVAASVAEAWGGTLTPRG